MLIFLPIGWLFSLCDEENNNRRRANATVITTVNHPAGSPITRTITRVQRPTFDEKNPRYKCGCLFHQKLAYLAGCLELLINLIPFFIYIGLYFRYRNEVGDLIPEVAERFGGEELKGSIFWAVFSTLLPLMLILGAKLKSSCPLIAYTIIQIIMVIGLFLLLGGTILAASGVTSQNDEIDERWISATTESMFNFENDKEIQSILDGFDSDNSNNIAYDSMEFDNPRFNSRFKRRSVVSGKGSYTPSSIYAVVITFLVAQIAIRIFAIVASKKCRLFVLDQQYNETASTYAMTIPNAIPNTGQLPPPYTEAVVIEPLPTPSQLGSSREEKGY